MGNKNIFTIRICLFTFLCRVHYCPKQFPIILGVILDEITYSILSIYSFIKTISKRLLNIQNFWKKFYFYQLTFRKIV